MEKTSRSDKIRLLIVIVNYRTPEMVLDCLESLLSAVDDIDAKVVVVDNDSQDDSDKHIIRWIRDNQATDIIKFIASDENSGFSGGNNLGIESICAENYLLLNSDTLIKGNAIYKLLDNTDKFPDAGLFSPRLEWPDGIPQESCFRFLTPVGELISAARTGPVTKAFAKYNVPIAVSDQISYPEWTSFACVLVRGQVFEDIGLMDDKFFMYFEDVEFCHRAGASGWKIINDPSAHVVHLRGGSSPVKENARTGKRLPRYYYESRTRYFYKLYGWKGLLKANLFWSLGRIISLTRELLGKKAPHVSHKQWLDIWANLRCPDAPYTKPK